MAEQRSSALEVTVVSVSRDAQDAWVRVATDKGEYFTQAGVGFPLKNGQGKLRLDGAGGLEALLIANAGRPVTLLLSQDVDGLILGVIPQGALASLDGIVLEAR